jgi:hypothetical protein
LKFKSFIAKHQNPSFLPYFFVYGLDQPGFSGFPNKNKIGILTFSNFGCLIKAIYNIPNQLCNAQLLLQKGFDSFVARFNIIVLSNDTTFCLFTIFIFF